MMEECRAVGGELKKQFQADYRSNPLLKAMTNALAKNSVDDVAFSPASAKATRFKFTIDIPTMKVTDQKDSGRCWIFSGLNVLREIVGKTCGIKRFELSQSYIAFWDKFEKCNYLLESVINLGNVQADDRNLSCILENGAPDGGQWDMLVNLIEKYGLVPKDAMGESYQSSHTTRMNRLINAKLRKGAAKLRRMMAEGAEHDALEAEKETQLSELYGFLCACYGEPPETFDFEYVDKEKNYRIERGLTPTGFYKKYVGDILEDYVSVIHAPTADKPFGQTYTVDYIGNVVGGKAIRYLNLNLPAFKKLVLAQLSNREVVWFGSDCGKYGDRENGVWDVNAFDYKTAFGMDFSLTKEEALDYRQSAMNHAMVITGVGMDAENKPSKWKIENSWSEKSGNKGYFVMSDSWFDLFVYQAVVHKKYLDPSMLKALETEPVHLHPWDPMGTLAD